MIRFEREKTAEFVQKLDQFKREADAELRAMEENLKKLQTDFQKNLESLNTERKRILDDSRKREEELKRQIEEKSLALETANIEAQEQLRKAAAEIRSLSEQKDRIQLVESQMAGFYGNIRDQIRVKNYNSASASIDSLRRFLSDPSISQIPSIQNRKNMDLLMMDTLSAMIDYEKARSSETGKNLKLLQKSEKLSDRLLQPFLQEAGNLQKGFTRKPFQRFYILSTYQYFEDMWRRQRYDKARAVITLLTGRCFLFRQV